MCVTPSPILPSPLLDTNPFDTPSTLRITNTLTIPSRDCWYVRSECATPSPSLVILTQTLLTHLRHSVSRTPSPFLHGAAGTSECASVLHHQHPFHSTQTLVMPPYLTHLLTDASYYPITQATMHSSLSIGLMVIRRLPSSGLCVGSVCLCSASSVIHTHPLPSHHYPSDIYLPTYLPSVPLITGGSVRWLGVSLLLRGAVSHHRGRE